MSTLLYVHTNVNLLIHLPISVNIILYLCICLSIYPERDRRMERSWLLSCARLADSRDSSIQQLLAQELPLELAGLQQVVPPPRTTLVMV